MATYKQPCIHCKEFIERDARFCSKCASRNPFGYSCPVCLRDIKKEQKLCEGCGSSLYTACPSCRQQTFKAERCEGCGESLMKKCEYKRCGEMQFFENVKCTACGKKI